MTALTKGDGTVLRIAGRDPAPALAEAAAEADATVAEVGSTGAPAVEPLVAVTGEGRTAYYAAPGPETMAAVVAAVDDGRVGTGDADAVVEHDPETASLPAPELGGLDVGERRVLGGAGWRRPADADALVEHDPETASLPAPELGGLDVGERRVLGGAGWRRPADADDHRAAGGFADAGADAAWAVAADLRGRGWGDWQHDAPLAEAWETAGETDGETAVVVNGHGVAADALALSSTPLEVLEGADAAARAVGADRIVVFASAADDDALDAVREAAANYPEPAAPVDVVAGPDEYRAGEPTMALEAVEGSDRLEARLRPPGPEAVGLHGGPTLVHTPRTLAHLAVALRDGAPAGSRLVTVTGDVAAPATVELPESDALETALEAVEVDGDLKAACVGGQFGGVTASLDVAAAPEALADAGLGTGGTVEVLADDRCVVEFVGSRASFAAEENCGRCVPCREGTTQLANLLRDVYDGDYDPEGVAELARVMETSSICEFGVAAGRPARTAVDAFDGEFEAHADGRCPAGACFDAMEVSS